MRCKVSNFCHSSQVKPHKKEEKYRLKRFFCTKSFCFSQEIRYFVPKMIKTE